MQHELPPAVELVAAARRFAIDPARIEYRSRLARICDTIRSLVNTASQSPAVPAPLHELLAVCELCLLEPQSGFASIHGEITAGLDLFNRRSRRLVIGDKAKVAPAVDRQPKQRARSKAKQPDLSWQQRADLQ